jgi:hypothetical protein
MTQTMPGRFAEAEDALHEEAARIAGDDDFGDPSYLEGLRVLLDAYDGEARLNEYGRTAARDQIRNVLVQRLRCEQQWRAHPEVLLGDIRRPIVICGLVRTGSTALHYLMGQDPDLQVLQYWLAGSPQPRPPRQTWEGHPDFRRAREEIDAMYAADPSLKAIHFMMPDGPEECRHLLMQEFTDDSFEANAHVPSYSAWYQQADMLGTYQRHRRLLQLIGSTDTERTWLLKYPVHMRFLRTFLEVYPDACVVQTHRDPLTVMPSYVSLIAGFRALHEDEIDRPAIARRQLELWASGAEDAIDLRRKRDSSQFYDLHFADFMADPVGSVRRIHGHFGRTLSDAGEQALRAWQAANPPDKHGRHTYSTAPEDVGLTRDAILDRFAEYMDYFGMRPER